MSLSVKPLLQTLKGETAKHVPVWFMRQAGRYLPEYRELRSKAGDFLSLCLTPDFAAEITLQPIRRFDLDAAILFADILLVPMALGLDLRFVQGEGPALSPLTEPSVLHYDPTKVLPVIETIKKVKPELPSHTALIGFCGSPWTVACYMIDGSSRDNFARAKTWVKEKPEELKKLIATLIDASEKYLAAQITAGAEVVQLFDSWAGLLSGEDFKNYVIEPTHELVTRLKKKFPQIPIIGFPREAGANYAPYIRQTGVDALSIDQKLDLNYAKSQLQTIKPLQGNLAPELLVEGGTKMIEAAEKILRTFGQRHIFNLGHGVTPETPPENVAELVAFIRKFES